MSLPPISFSFVTKDDDNKSQLTFHVMESDLDPITRFMVIVPQKIGCMSVSFDPTPKSDDTTVTIQSVAYHSECAEEGLPRKYGTRSMILGMLNVLKTIAKDRYPHLSTIELNDEASYPCPPFAVREDGKIKTFATDLLLQGNTYYERHLHITPCRETTKNILKTVKARVSRPADVSFSMFWKALVGEVANDTERKPEQLDWLSDHKESVREHFERHASVSWRNFFRSLYEQYNCVFFSCCWWRLCILFVMTRLVGAAWSVSFDRLPPKAFTLYQGGGGGKRRRGRSSIQTRKVREEIKSVIMRKLRGDPNNCPQKDIVDKTRTVHHL
jgi:hypothetical protein